MTSVESNADKPAPVYMTRTPSNADATKASDGDIFGEWAMIALAAIVVIIFLISIF